ncbi:MAG: adenylate kinase [Chloroflexota bacterium]|nr:MAG: adenylate kinase [Chloroflexota bacterium]
MTLYLNLMGVQGAGKGVQASFISQTYGIPHVSTGVLFRAMKTRTDDLARRIQQIITEGALVPDDITNEVVRDRLEQPDAAPGAVLDGYPRNEAQARWLDEYLASQGKALSAVLLLKLDLFTALKRAFGRVLAADGRAYNIFYDDAEISWSFEEHPQGAYPPRLAAVHKASGERLVRRPDDANVAAIIKRIDTYLDQTAALIRYYDGRGLLIEINADQPIAAVSSDIQAAVDRLRAR